jgi:hypothetical protein
MVCMTYVCKWQCRTIHERGRHAQQGCAPSKLLPELQTMNAGCCCCCWQRLLSGRCTTPPLSPSNSYTTTKQQQCCMHVNTVVILLPPPPPSPNSPLMFTVTLQASLFSTSTAGRAGLKKVRWTALRGRFLRHWGNASVVTNHVIDDK